MSRRHPHYYGGLCNLCGQRPHHGPCKKCDGCGGPLHVGACVLCEKCGKGKHPGVECKPKEAA